MSRILDRKAAGLARENAELRQQLAACRAELQEARAQQTATAEVLQVINSSPGDLAPVFDAMLDKALGLCDAAFGGLWTFEGEHYVAVALRGVPAAYAEFLTNATMAPGPGTAPYRLRNGERIVHNVDLAAEEAYRAGDPQRRALVDLGGARTALQVALRRDEDVLGVITIFRQEVRPFTDRQTALLESFAAQAVVAMENARLLGELRARTRDLEESLEYQTAISDVLKVISGVAFDLAPVLHTVVTTAIRLCRADEAVLYRKVDEEYRWATGHSLDPEYEQIEREMRIRPGVGTLVGRAASEARTVQILDAWTDPLYEAKADARVGGIHTMLGVPLLRDGEPIGVLGLARRRVEAYTDKEIELVRTFADQAVIAIENTRLITETREALEQQTATAEVLQVINGSPVDLALVFDALLEKAMRLCAVDHAALELYDGERMHAVAVQGASDKFAETLRHGYPATDSPASRALLEGQRYAEIADAAQLDHVAFRTAAEVDGIHTVLFVPLRRDEALLGMISLARHEVRQSSEKEIALLQNFAAQAVIAMENARLLTETREALEQQTATAEVLQVINSSPGDLAPVFEAVLAKATTLCDAAFGILWTYDGERFRPVAFNRMPPAFAEFMREYEREGFLQNPRSTGGLGAMVRGEPFALLLDAREGELYRSGGTPLNRAFVELGGARSGLIVPLRQDEKLLGAIRLFRQEVRPFTDKQIALLQNFAAQAVIAMENARLLTETREALEQQTATAEVLRVINSSPGDLAPVFDALLQKARALCVASFGGLMTYDGERFQPVALQGVPKHFNEFLEQGIRPQPGDPFGRMVEGAPYSHLRDVSEVAAQYPDNPLPRAAADLGGVRTFLAVPLRKDGVLLGVITAYRQQVQPFTDKQIALLQNFAAQAVIAMENARLLTETREALEQQTATAEVLQVINSSPGDLTPVFDAMLEKAMRLCQAAFGILLVRDGSRFRTAAQYGVPAALAEFLSRTPREPGRHTAVGRMLDGEDFVQFEDFAKEPAYEAGDPRQRAFVELGGARTYVAVPLRKDGELVGTIAAYRREVRPFSDKQIVLLQNFAAQAVIAMENARLLTETREALEQQTATAEVLQVINSSPGDLTPVFDAMLEKAVRLCDFAFAALWTYDGTAFHPVALHGMPAAFEAYLREHTPPAFELLHASAGPIHFPDVMATEMPQRDPEFARGAQQLGSVRTLLLVPLRKDAGLLGAFVAYRQEVRPFSDKQISLLQNFAAQAVIAIENARLLTETREALEQQTATAEVLQVINSSPGELAPVFDTMLEKATDLCEASYGVLCTYDGAGYRATALRGVPAAYAEFLTAGPLRPGPGNGLARVAAGEKIVHVLDVAAEDIYHSGESLRRALVDLGGARTVLTVALLKDEALLGAFIIYRQEVRPFSDKQIALVQNFAAQAVIAIENARLFNELRESLAQQQAIAEVLGVINANPGNLQPVFDAILEKAHSLCGVVSGCLQLHEDGKFRAVAARGIPGAVAEMLRPPVAPQPGAPPLRLVAGERIVQVADLRAGSQHQFPRARVWAEHGMRTALYVPLRRHADLLGFISAYRDEVRLFSEMEIALLENFAAQAVIAMDNARLLDEIRQRQAELRVTFDNMGDGVVMFDDDLRLAAWNRNFQELLDLPDAVLTARPSYADYLHILAERGEFGSDDVEGELNRRLAETGEELRLERTRPDGRVIEARRNMVPGGGFVLIYSDITERKRAEGEIRGARDAAERALGELQTAQASLIHAEKMASLGQLTAGIAHEIKNPLNFINNFAGLSVEMLDELKTAAAPAVAALDGDTRNEIGETFDTLTGNLDKIAEHGRRADGIVNSMLAHSRGSSGQRQRVDLNALIDEALNLAYHGARAQDQSFNITLERDFDQNALPIELAAQEITRVFLNLIGNSFYATNKRRVQQSDMTFEPKVKVTTCDHGGAVEIRVRDNGAGIAPELRDKLFQPFFTTKPTGEGTGLGLSISYDIVTQQHGGTITVDSQPGEYTEFTIRLPRAAAVGGGKAPPRPADKAGPQSF